MGANGGEFSCQPLARGLPNASIQQVSHVLRQCCQHLRHLCVDLVIAVIIALHRQHQRMLFGLFLAPCTQLHQRREAARLVDGVRDLPVFGLQCIGVLGMNEPVTIPAVVAVGVLDLGGMAA